MFTRSAAGQLIRIKYATVRFAKHFARMPHLRLNLYNATGDAPDDEGADFKDMDDARFQAIAGIRSVLSAEVLDGEINMQGRLEIVDDSGALLDTITFVDALNVIPAIRSQSS